MIHPRSQLLTPLCIVIVVLSASSMRTWAASAPISFYRAEGNGKDAMNQHDASVPVTDANNPGLNFAPGKVGQAFRFTGLINVGGSNTGTSVDFGNWLTYESFTLAMWIKDDAAQGSPQATNAPVFTLFDYFNGTDWSLVYNNTGNQYLYSSVDGVHVTLTTTPGLWQYLIVTRDGTSRVTNVYLDGQLVGSGTGSGDLNVDPSFVSLLRAGADYNLSIFWKGEIDEFRIYDRQVSVAEVAPLSSSSGIDLIVPGSADPYLAGMPNGSNANGDTAPAQSPVLIPGITLRAGQVLTFTAAGATDSNGGTPVTPPDGGNFVNVSSLNGISGCNYPLNSLVGVFLDNSLPTGSAAPASLDFSAGGNVTGGIDYGTLAPALKQVFFIGDGVNASRAVQQVTLPTGATRLYLASSDASNWANNTGSFSVRITSPGGFSPPVSNALDGYWLVGSDGGVFTFGTAGYHGSTAGTTLNYPIVGMEATPTNRGYWLVASDGGIFAFGDAVYHGSTAGTTLNYPIVGMERSPTGRGYLLVASDGGIFAFGDAVYHGSTAGTALSHPIVGMKGTPSGRGYWLVASDGGIFPFGDAGSYGSTAGISLSYPIVGVESTPTGRGYWLVASDGGIFAFGDAVYHGSTAGTALSHPIVSMEATPTGRGYWLVASDGGIFAFGDAPFLGSAAGLNLSHPVVGIESAPQLIETLGSITTLSNGHILLQGMGAPSNLTHLQVALAPDTASFSTMTDISIDQTGTFTFEDAAATGQVRRFYRLTFP